MKRIPVFAWGFLVPSILAIAGCGAGGAGGDDDSGGSFEQALGRSNAAYLVADLDAGTLEPRTAVDDLVSNPAYRDALMVLRRIEVDGHPVFLGVFETTQAQWRRIAGQTPWTGAPVSVVGPDAVGDDRPAFALRGSDVVAALDAYATRTSLHLVLPEVEAWESACQAGGARWSWGDDHSQATLDAHCVVQETRMGRSGPLPVGGRLPAGQGFYDLYGNVWELVAPGDRAVGGSWHDPVHAGRSGIRLDRDNGQFSRDARSVLVGVRLAVVP